MAQRALRSRCLRLGAVDRIVEPQRGFHLVMRVRAQRQPIELRETVLEVPLVVVDAAWRRPGREQSVASAPASCAAPSRRASAQNRSRSPLTGGETSRPAGDARPASREACERAERPRARRRAREPARQPVVAPLRGATWPSWAPGRRALARSGRPPRR